MDSEDFAFLMRGAFASVISRNFDSNIGVSSKVGMGGGESARARGSQRVSLCDLYISIHHTCVYIYILLPLREREGERERARALACARKSQCVCLCDFAQCLTLRFARVSI